MQRKCLGCRKQLKLGQQLQEQGLRIQFKNYQFPIKSEKTINSFLNTKGGTVYASVDDSSRRVIGLRLTLKEQDQFKQLVHQVCRNMNPKIQHSEEEVRVIFVPVLDQNEVFTGLYVPKIVVKRGDPTQLYTFSETLILMENQKRKDFQIVYAFERSNVSCDRVKHQDLKSLIKSRSRLVINQRQIQSHSCHPAPNYYPSTTLSIVGPQKLVSIVQKIFEKQSELKGIKLIISNRNKVSELKTNSQQCLFKLIQIVNSQILDIQKNNKIFCRLDGFVLYVAEFQRDLPKPIQIILRPLSESRSKERSLSRQKRQQIKHFKKQQSKQAPKFQARKSNPKIKSSHKLAGYKLLITHIFPQKREELINILKLDFQEAIQGFKKAKNSIIVYLNSQQSLKLMLQSYQKKKEIIQQKFGFKNKITIGRPANLIHIEHIDPHLKDQALEYLLNKLDCQGMKLKISKVQRRIQIKGQLQDLIQILDALIEDKTMKKRFAKGLFKLKYFLQVL